MLYLFFPAMAIGLVAPLARQRRIPVLAACAVANIALMAYVYATADPVTLGLAASNANRREAAFLSASEAVVLVLSFLALRRSRIFFWLAWSCHALLTAFCVAVIIWLTFFWHW